MKTRQERLLPNGMPRWVRCYDSGPELADRYTVVFTGNYPKQSREFHYLAMSAHPFHPQGFGQHGETRGRPRDVSGAGWPPAMGRRCHLGKRVPFTALPVDCQRLVLMNYRGIWGLP
ncbi:MAG: hypothetical protein E6Q97_38780 [Desulfurellales bacterium]|nr:MAG: hypothetical protein E6Q97_38780 [Desulfurellales bacterium]